MEMTTSSERYGKDALQTEIVHVTVTGLRYSLVSIDCSHQQAPGYLVTSLGAEVIIESSCFVDNNLGPGGSPVLLGLANVAPKFEAKDNFVVGTDCDFVSEILPDGSTPMCSADVKASATECQSSAKDLPVFW